MIKFRLEHVHYMPTELEPGVLYISEEFETAAHLCACGCKSKIRTPLGPTEWEITETEEGVTLYPSIGNWQQKCQSHYWIEDSAVRWAPKWTSQQIVAGRHREEERRRSYYEARNNKKVSKLRQFWARIKNLWKW